MRIASNSVSEGFIRQMQHLGGKQVRLQNEVATGQRIAQLEDDPAAAGRVLKLESERRQLTQFSANSARALEVARATTSGLRSMMQVSDRAGELATLGAGAVGPSEMSAFAAEMHQLVEQALQFGNTRFNGEYLFAGTAVDTQPFVATRGGDGKVNSVAYAGNGDQAAIATSDVSAVTPGTAAATNTAIRDFLEQLVALRDAFASGSSTSVRAVQASLAASEDAFVSALADSGSVQGRIEASQAQQSERRFNLESLISSETDADLPTTIVKLNQTQTAYQAALQSAATIMRLSLLDYIK